MNQKQNNKNKILVLASTLAGTVLTGGALFYYFKKQQRDKSFSLSLQYELKQYFATPAMKLQLKNRQINQLTTKFIEQIAKNINKNKFIDFIDQTQNKIQPVCSIPLQQHGEYYFCEDCSIEFQNRKDTGEKVAKDAELFTICTDCFDESQHVGHKYTKKEKKENNFQVCDCGMLQVVNPQAFCEKHQGVDFEKLKEQFQNIDQLAVQEFTDIFKTYLQQIIQYAEKLNFQDIEIYNEKKTHINVLLNTFFQHMTSFLDTNYIFAYIFSDMFIQKFENAKFNHKCDKNDELDFQNPLSLQENCECLILLNTLRLSPLLKTETNEIISNFLKRIFYSNLDFQYELTKIVFCNSNMLVSENEITLEDGYKITIKTPIPSFYMPIYPLINQDSCLKVIEDIGDQVFNPLRQYLALIQNTDPRILPLCFEMVEALTAISLLLFTTGMEVCCKVAELPECLEVLFELAYHVETIVPQGVNHIQVFCSWMDQNITSVLHQQITETAVRSCLNSIFYFVLKSGNTALLDKIAYQAAGITNNYLQIIEKSIQQVQKSGLKYLTLTSVIMTAPFLIAANTIQEFPNKDNVSRVWKKYFKLNSQQELIKFVSRVSSYQNHYIFFDKDGYQCVWEYFDKGTAEIPDLNTVVKTCISFGREIVFMAYDENLFARQVTGLFEKETQMFSTQLFNSLKKVTESLQFDQMAQHQFLSQFDLLIRVLYDGSSIANYYSYKPELVIKSEQEITKVKDLVINQFKYMVITLMQVLNSDGVNKKDLKNGIQEYIHEFYDVNDDILLEICNFDEKSNLYSLKQEFKNKFYQENFQRDIINNSLVFKKALETIKSDEKGDKYNLNFCMFSNFDLNLKSPETIKRFRINFLTNPKIYTFIFTYLLTVKSPTALPQLGILLRGILEIFEEYYIENKKEIYEQELGQNAEQEINKIYEVYIGNELEEPKKVYQAIQHDKETVKYYNPSIPQFLNLIKKIFEAKQELQKE